MTSIFSKIISGEIPSNYVYEDEQVIVIHDNNPQARHHLLVIPKKEIPTINDILPEDSQLIAHMFFIAKLIAKQEWFSEGYKLHFNVWEKWGQEIMHIHLHILSDIS